MKWLWKHYCQQNRFEGFPISKHLISHNMLLYFTCYFKAFSSWTLVLVISDIMSLKSRWNQMLKEKIKSWLTYGHSEADVSTSIFVDYNLSDLLKIQRLILISWSSIRATSMRHGNIVWSSNDTYMYGVLKWLTVVHSIDVRMTYLPIRN